MDTRGATDAGHFVALYELAPLPSDPNGLGVLRVQHGLLASKENTASLSVKMTDLAPLRAKLLNIRDNRRQPFRDEKIVVSLNGLAITGLAHAGKVLGETEWVASARRAGEFLWQTAFDETSGRLRHHVFQGEAAGEGFLDDYALLGLGFIALGEATGDQVWFLRAQALASAIMTRFMRPDGLLVTSTTDANLIGQAMDLDDYEMPSGT